MEKKYNIELSFSDVVLLRLGLHELRRSYSLRAEKLADEGFPNDALDFKERIAKIDKLDSIFMYLI